MKVKELIEILQNCNQEAEVLIGEYDYDYMYTSYSDVKSIESRKLLKCETEHNTFFRNREELENEGHQLMNDEGVEIDVVIL